MPTCARHQTMYTNNVGSSGMLEHIHHTKLCVRTLGARGMRAQAYVRRRHNTYQDSGGSSGTCKLTYDDSIICINTLRAVGMCKHVQVTLYYIMYQNIVGSSGMCELAYGIIMCIQHRGLVREVQAYTRHLLCIQRSGRGIVVRVLESGLYGSIPTLAWFVFEAYAISFTTNLPQYTRLQISTTLLGRYLRWTSVMPRSQYNCTLIACAK